MKRPENVSFEDYKKALKMHKKQIKQYLKGVIIWPSAAAGTYIRKLHGIIGHKRGGNATSN